MELKKYLHSINWFKKIIEILDDSLLNYMQAITKLTVFEMRQTTFKSMQSSGQINLIPDFQFRRELINYYHMAEGLQIFQGVMTDYFNRFIVPAMLNNIDMQNEKIVNRAYFHTFKFKNIVVGFWSLLQQQITLYRSVKKKAFELKKIIEQNF